MLLFQPMLGFKFHCDKCITWVFVSCKWYICLIKNISEVDQHEFDSSAHGPSSADIVLSNLNLGPTKR